MNDFLAMKLTAESFLSQRNEYMDKAARLEKERDAAVEALKKYTTCRHSDTAPKEGTEINKEWHKAPPRPMSEAPRDGTKILVLVDSRRVLDGDPLEKKGYKIAWFGDMQIGYEYTPGWQDEYYILDESKLLNWRPLPEWEEGVETFRFCGFCSKNPDPLCAECADATYQDGGD